VELPNIRGKASPKRSTRPITANLADTQYEVVEQVCWDLDWNIALEKEAKQWDIRWVDSAVSVDILSKMQSHQKINHFPGMSVLSRKNNLAKNLYKMQAAYPQHYSYAPKTFLLPADLSLLRAYYNDARRRGVVKTFIVKPEASCQGRGIFLTQSLSGTHVDISETSNFMGSAWCRPTSTIPSSTRG
jgi:tubulin polyglutamylase TTLL6/13